jgi:hypothetical protein
LVKSHGPGASTIRENGIDFAIAFVLIPWPVIGYDGAPVTSIVAKKK